ncbi:serine/threonine-protein kinase [Gemmatimonas groenlandica]|uniref:Serine/threonine protein kinase n=1 Tax=Gemmatimonas groenlandica TaxID=2732249 RepID=A0A6M4IZ55_9BACT|nr:serine/threonine-protein kinase [Gemmatimonas groenlandica]QJR37511.1 serine/threonine protein kinase [Gemmatimonas groenlandica]
MIEKLPTGEWQRVEAVLGGALERTGSARRAFVDQACTGDEALRREVTSLLAAHDRTGAVDALAADIAPLAAGLRIGGTSPGDGEHDQEASTLVGRTITPYRIVSHLGHGGMGVVYEAFDARLQRPVALKFLSPHLTNDRHAQRRFETEARAAAALDHPNICTVSEIGTTDGGERFLVMPLYIGETLHERIARGPLAIPDAVEIAVQIARGLAKAHDAGIVHRDIKPSNLFITQDGVVKILDFGIAKLLDQAIVLSGGGLLGTPAYMSPEQVRGERIDAGTDVWAVGVVLYEMLTGARPFHARGAALLARITHAEPTPLPNFRTDLPDALVTLIQRALSKKRADRPSSMREIEGELLALGVLAEGTVEVEHTGANVGLATGARVVAAIVSALRAILRKSSARPRA